MAAFLRQDSEDLVIWTGNPDCQAGHDSMLAWLKTVCPRDFMVTVEEGDVRTKGNLGESLAFFIGHSHSFSTLVQRFAPNALTPLSGISKAEIDIVWLYFGNKPDEDYAVLQEVKTTSTQNLDHGNKLIDDYRALFETDMNLTLSSRLDQIKSKLEFERGLPELTGRVTKLAGKSPQTSTRIRLVPTVVHELSNDPKKRMAYVRTSLLGMKWSSEAIQNWAIGITDLDDRFERLAKGEN